MKMEEDFSRVEEGLPRAARIRITVNGEERRLAPSTTLATFLSEQDVPVQFVAVAVNNEVVRRAEHPHVVLQDGDVVEVVRMVGGGSGYSEEAVPGLNLRPLNALGNLTRGSSARSSRR